MTSKEGSSSSHNQNHNHHQNSSSKSNKKKRKRAGDHHEQNGTRGMGEALKALRPPELPAFNLTSARPVSAGNESNGEDPSSQEWQTVENGVSFSFLLLFFESLNVC